MPNPPSAAAALYPHLQRDQPPRQQQRAQSSLAGALYPKQTAEAKRWAEFCERDRQSLLKHLREARIRAEKR